MHVRRLLCVERELDELVGSILNLLCVQATPTIQKVDRYVSRTVIIDRINDHPWAF